MSGNAYSRNKMISYPDFQANYLHCQRAFLQLLMSRSADLVDIIFIVDYLI